MSTQTKGKLYTIIASMIGMSILLGACTSPTPAPTEAPPPPSPMPVEPVSTLLPISQAELTAVTWEWVGGRDNSTTTYQVADSQNYTLNFADDGSLFVVADCNTSRSTYELSGETLTISPGATTRVACEPDSLSDQFLLQLEQASRVGTGFGNLVIVLADQVSELYFQGVAVTPATTELEPVTQEEIVDIRWQWTNLVETDPPSEAGIGDPANYDLVLRMDGTYSAKADCNQLNGTYELVGSQFNPLPRDYHAGNVRA